MQFQYFLPVWLLSAALLAACSGDDASSTNASVSPQLDLRSKTIIANQAAYIPAQCYTQTLDQQGRAHNPCFSCHIPTKEPNYLNDGDLQLAYSFAEYANTNRWANLFKDRSQQIATISDESILQYVRSDNYRTPAQQLTLAEQLKQVPRAWDFNEDGVWSGYIPDCYMHFDSEGFDRAPDQTYTGWRAFAYTPFLGTFWPTNGSTDDVIIRLAEPFRQNGYGQPDQAIYQINLAIVEALIKQQNIAIAPTDELQLGVDLDKNGVLNTATQITYDWAPLEGRLMSYVGLAKTKQEAGELHLAAGLYPEGTEFLHSVRYIDLDEQGQVHLAARMKELRYARKTTWHSYTQLKDKLLAEVKEKDAFPDRLRQLIGNIEMGISNGQGWQYQGFIEDKQGALRPQTYEETTACMGCHGGIGATTDSSFAFPRKLGSDGFQHGWYHWSQQGLNAIPEPKRADGQYEYTHYLQQNQAGDEFRANAEIVAKFFDNQGQLKPAALTTLHTNITELLLPSAARALSLNKAYKTIVEEQSFIDGRDAFISSPHYVHRHVEPDQTTGITTVIEGPRGQ